MGRPEWVFCCSKFFLSRDLRDFPFEENPQKGVSGETNILASEALMKDERKRLILFSNCSLTFYHETKNRAVSCATLIKPILVYSGMFFRFFPGHSPKYQGDSMTQPNVFNISEVQGCGPIHQIAKWMFPICALLFKKHFQKSPLDYFRR